ncbi:MAG: hypothetical protein WCC27_05360 [Acidobacteriaceae bacterium]
MTAGKPIGIERAPTRWGRVDYRIEPRGNQQLAAVIDLPEKEQPAELHVSFRLPPDKSMAGLTVNGKTVTPGGRHKDAAIFSTSGQRKFEVIATMS